MRWAIRSSSSLPTDWACSLGSTKPAFSRKARKSDSEEMTLSSALATSFCAAIITSSRALAERSLATFSADFRIACTTASASSRRKAETDTVTIPEGGST